jgi:hypothetical protein
MHHNPSWEPISDSGGTEISSFKYNPNTHYRVSVAEMEIEVWFLRSRLAQPVQWLATGWTTGRSGFDPRQGQRIFPLTSVSIPALSPTQPPVQWAPGVLSPGQSAAGVWRWPFTPIYCWGQEWVGAIPPLPLSAILACSGTALLFYFSGTLLHQTPHHRRHQSFVCISCYQSINSQNLISPFPASHERRTSPVKRDGHCLL